MHGHFSAAPTVISMKMLQPRCLDRMTFEVMIAPQPE